jgi:cystathionine beta-lyase/cystathionine gamma-synthase
VITPVFQTSPTKQDGIGKHRGYEYARTANPDARRRSSATSPRWRRESSASRIRRAWRRRTRFCASSARATRSSSPTTCYGGTYRLFELVLKQLGYVFKFVDTSDLKQVEAALSPKTKLVFLESPTNPMLRVTDIRAVCDMAHTRGATGVRRQYLHEPALQNPIELGADIVVHSTDQVLERSQRHGGGWSSFSTTKRKRRSCAFCRTPWAQCPGPMDCFLALRGTKTLAVRMKQHEENARELAVFLARHPALKSVNYPGLPTHPQHELAKKQARGFGALISFDTGSLENADKVLQGTKLFTLAESLGGVES